MISVQVTWVILEVDEIWKMSYMLTFINEPGLEESDQKQCKSHKIEVFE